MDKNYLKLTAVMSLAVVLLVSGCAQSSVVGPASTNTPSKLAEACGNSAEINSYTFDIEGDSFARIDLARIFEAKCNIFTKCYLDSDKNLFKLYTRAVESSTEEKILKKVEFKTYMTTEPLVEKNETKLSLEGKDYFVKVIDDTNLEVDGKKVIRDQEFTLGNYSLKFFNFNEGPVFQVLVIETGDVFDVLLDPQITGIKVEDDGLAIYSLGIIYSNSSIKKIADLAKNIPFEFVFRPTGPNSTNVTGESRLKSQLYFYADGGLLSSVYLPASVKEQGENLGNTLAVNGVGATIDIATRQFRWLSYSLKLASSPEVKILNKERVDCTQLK